jgi:hypothetical protein
MKNTLIVLLGFFMLSIFSCVKNRQQLFHHKNWKNIQGTWDIEEVSESGKSVVDSIKRSYCNLYCKLEIKYNNSKESDGYLHMYRSCASDDLGQIKIEEYNYKKIQICKHNFNIIGNATYYPCKNKYNLYDTCIVWNIDELTTSSLVISTPIRGNFYKVKYMKI